MHLLISYGKIVKETEKVKQVFGKLTDKDELTILSEDDGFLMTQDTFNILRDVKCKINMLTCDNDIETYLLIGHAIATHDKLTILLDSNKEIKAHIENRFPTAKVTYGEEVKKPRKKKDTSEIKEEKKEKEVKEKVQIKTSVPTEDFMPKPVEKETTAKPAKTSKKPMPKPKLNKTVATAQVLEDSEEDKATGEFVKALLNIKSDIALSDYADEIYASIKHGGMSDTYNITLPFQLQIRCGQTHSKEVYHAIEEYVGELRKFVK